MERQMSVTNETRDLRVRSLIADKEMMVAAAHRDMATFGEWRCHYDARCSQINVEILRLLKEMEADRPEPEAGRVSVECERERVMLLGRYDGPHAHKPGWAWLLRLRTMTRGTHGDVLSVAEVELDDGRDIEVLQGDVVRQQHYASG
jgi:hypothetical protein